MTKSAKNFEFIEQLPFSAHPWKIYRYEDGVVLMNQEHPPMLFRGGRMEKITYQKRKSLWFTFQKILCKR